MQQQQLKLADFINVYSKTREGLFLQPTKNKTVDMKYKAFVEMSLEKFNPLIREYVDPFIAQMKDCKTPKEIRELDINLLPDHIRDEMLLLVDKQKVLNIVERAYLFLDLYNTVSNTIQGSILQGATHYIRSLELANSTGGHILGLNGRPLS
jgi:hypothetical protein